MGPNMRGRGRGGKGPPATESSGPWVLGRSIFLKWKDLAAPCQEGQFPVGLAPGILRIIRKKRRRTGSGQGRGAGGASRERWAEMSSLVRGAGLSHSGEPRAASSHFSITGNINTCKSAEGHEPRSLCPAWVLESHLILLPWVPAASLPPSFPPILDSHTHCRQLGYTSKK